MDCALLALRSCARMRKKVVSSVGFVNTSAIMQLEITSLQIAISRITAYFTKIVAVSKWRDLLDAPSRSCVSRTSVSNSGKTAMQN